MSYRRAWLLLAGCAALAGCNTWYSHIGDEDSALGEAAKYDAAIQVINPIPVYAANSAQPGSNGEVGQKAVERYRTDKVKAVEQMQTTSGTGASSGPK
jgi:hypothetical protein